MPLHPFLVKSNLYKLIGKFCRPYYKAYQYVDYLNFVKKHNKTGQINDYYNKSAKYENRYQLHNSILKDLKNKSILYYEFGVAGGDMIRYWSTQNQSKDSRFVGFDSFEGLPESWENKAEKHFNQGGKFPDIKDSRVSFVKGWFQDSVYEKLSQSEFNKQCVFHLDADLFSSTLYVLFQLHPKLKSGDILIFDEFSSHEHEYKALEIFKKCCNNKWKFEFIGAVNNYRQVAFILK